MVNRLVSWFGLMAVCCLLFVVCFVDVVISDWFSDDWFFLIFIHLHSRTFHDSKNATITKKTFFFIAFCTRSHSAINPIDTRGVRFRYGLHEANTIFTSRVWRSNHRIVMFRFSKLRLCFLDTTFPKPFLDSQESLHSFLSWQPRFFFRCDKIEIDSFINPCGDWWRGSRKEIVICIFFWLINFKIKQTQISTRSTFISVGVSQVIP